MTAVAERTQIAFVDAWAPPPAKSPALAPDEVHLWRIDLDAFDELALAALSEPERQREARFLRRIDGSQFARTRAAVRDILGRYLHVPPADVQFATGRSGKPGARASDGHAGPAYNSTHSHRLALCAVGRVDVGVDLEWFRPAPMAAGVAAGIVSPDGPIRPDEMASPERDWTFFQAWTRTEAALKATGEGLSAIDRRQPEIIRALAERRPERYHASLRIADIPISLEYVGALAIIDVAAVQRVRCWSWPGPA